MEDEIEAYDQKIKEFDLTGDMFKDDQEKNKLDTMKFLIELGKMRMDHELKLREQKEQNIRVMMFLAIICIFVATILVWFREFKI